MKYSNIRLKIELDEQHVPEKIFWEADDAPEQGLQEAKAAALAIWDQQQQSTLRIDLWAKDMPVHEMKRFHIDILGGLANTLRGATGDEYMATEIEKMCDIFVEHLKKEAQQQS